MTPQWTPPSGSQRLSALIRVLAARLSAHRFALESGHPYPSKKTVASRMRLTPRQVQRAIAAT